MVQGIKDGWFTELSTMWPGMGMSLKAEEVLYTGRSKFQVCALSQGYLGLKTCCATLPFLGAAICALRDVDWTKHAIAHLRPCRT